MGTRKKVAGTLAILSLGLLFWSAPIFTTNHGEITLRYLAVFLASFFGLRYLALHQWGVRRGTLFQRLSVRAGAWGILVLPLWLGGFFQETPFGLPVGLLCAVDLLTCTLARDPRPETEDEAPAPMAWGVKLILTVFAVAAGALFHFLVAERLTYGRLLEWAVGSLVACAALWYLLRRGPKGREGLPPRYRVHKPRSVPVPDPLSAPLEKAVKAFLKDGDSGGLLQAAEAIGRAWDLPPAAQKKLRADMLAALARSGTRREDDLRNALAAMQRALEVPFTPTAPAHPRS